MSSIIVTTIDIHPPVTFVSHTNTEAAMQVAEWAVKEWVKHFDLPCPSDLDVVVNRVLNFRNAEVRSEIKTLQ